MGFFRRFRYNSPVILTFTLISLGVLVLGQMTGGKSTLLLFSVYRSSPKDPLTYVRLFGHVLGHADFTHWSGNMMIFLLVGPILEEKYGSRQLLQMFAVVALATGIVNMIFFPDTALMGASGIVFMMIILSSVVSVGRGEIPMTLILVVILYLGQEVYDGMFTADNISQLTHIIGAVIGCIYGFALQRGRGRKK